MGPIPLLIGSWATHFWFPEFRQGADIDCYAPLRAKSSLPFEVHAAGYNNGVISLYELTSTEVELLGVRCLVATPEMLLAIKRIHLEFPRKWLKNISDYAWLRCAGVNLGDDTIRVFGRRFEYLRMNLSEAYSSEQIPNGVTVEKLSALVESHMVSPVKAAEYFLLQCGVELEDL